MVDINQFTGLYHLYFAVEFCSKTIIDVTKTIGTTRHCVL